MRNLCFEIATHYLAFSSLGSECGQTPFIISTEPFSVFFTHSQTCFIWFSFVHFCSCVLGWYYLRPSFLFYTPDILSFPKLVLPLMFPFSMFFSRFVFLILLSVVANCVLHRRPPLCVLGRYKSSDQSPFIAFTTQPRHWLAACDLRNMA